MITCKAVAKKNEFGYWVGWLEYLDGSVAAVTNAFYEEEKAFAIAESMGKMFNEEEKAFAIAENMRKTMNENAEKQKGNTL